MTFETWLLFASAILIASISPGPNVLVVVVNTITNGWRGAIFTILGNLACLFCIALIAAIGVGTLIANIPVAYLTMKIAGGLYLAWMGFKMIRASFQRQARLDLGNTDDAANEKSALGLASEAFLISASNPKSILFLSAVFPQFIRADALLAPQFITMFVTIICLVCGVHGVYALMASRFANRPFSNRIRRWMARITGGAFISLGAGVALSK